MGCKCNRTFLSNKESFDHNWPSHNSSTRIHNNYQARTARQENPLSGTRTRPGWTSEAAHRRALPSPSPHQDNQPHCGSHTHHHKAIPAVQRATLQAFGRGISSPLHRFHHCPRQPFWLGPWRPAPSSHSLRSELGPESGIWRKWGVEQRVEGSDLGRIW